MISIKAENTASTVKTGGFFSMSAETIVGGCWTLNVQISYRSYFDQSCLFGVYSVFYVYLFSLTYSVVYSFLSDSSFLSLFSGEVSSLRGSSILLFGLSFSQIYLDYLWFSSFQTPATMSLNFLFLLLNSIQLKYSSSTYKRELLSIDLPTIFFDWTKY